MRGNVIIGIGILIVGFCSAGLQFYTIYINNYKLLFHSACIEVLLIGIIIAVGFEIYGLPFSDKEISLKHRKK